MSKGVQFSGTDGQILRSPFSSSLDQVYFNPEEPVVLADIYYGKMAGSGSFMPTADYIIANFSGRTGEVGGIYPNPQQYSFPLAANQYIYFLSKDLPSGVTYGYRTINLIRSGTKIATYSSSPYNNIQNVAYNPPSPTGVPPDVAVTQYFGRIQLNGVRYRIWKSNLPYNLTTIVNVYSIPE